MYLDDNKAAEDDALYSPISTTTRPSPRAKAVQVAPELSDIVIYMQATKFKVSALYTIWQWNILGFPGDRRDHNSPDPRRSFKC